MLNFFIIKTSIRLHSLRKKKREKKARKHTGFTWLKIKCKISPVYKLILGINSDTYAHKVKIKRSKNSCCHYYKKIGMTEKVDLEN